MASKTLYELGVKERFTELLKWSPYFFWQYGFRVQYLKMMILAGAIILAPALYDKLEMKRWWKDVSIEK
ncbi:MAG: hypothetical protein ACYTFW_03755 [Planctomycetota bacterium]|jgi:hypothetical protein